MAAARGYIIRVGSAQRRVAYGPWVEVDGYSERVLPFLAAHEAAD